jgi:hypothetical protein
VEIGVPDAMIKAKGSIPLIGDLYHGGTLTIA